MNGAMPVTDNSGSLTVDAPVGTPVFVRLSDGSSAIATLPVSVASLPGQAADNAAALPAVLYVVGGWDGTNVQALATDSSGLLQVDVVGALPAGTNNIGDVDIASIAAGDNNIGNVDVVTLPSIPAGTNNIGDVDVLTLPSIPAGNNNIGDVDIASALPAGTNAIGKLAANSGVDIGDVDVTSISAGTNTIGNVGVVGRTTGGLSIFRSIDLDETEEDVKTSAGQLFGWYLFNAHTATLYVKIYNATAANVTVGSTTPVLTIPVPAGSAANAFTDIGIAFGTAITAACTTGVADADTGAPAANVLIANLFYT